MSKIRELQKTAAGTLKINWSAVEETIGFPLHSHLKDFYSRIWGVPNMGGEIVGSMKFSPGEFLKRDVNRENWLDCSHAADAQFTLYLLKQADENYVSDFIHAAFFGEWTGGNDFGHRAWIGEIVLNIGQIYLLFHNDTGAFEWADFEYGYFERYSDNPYGIVADDTQEFLDKFTR